MITKDLTFSLKGNADAAAVTVVVYRDGAVVFQQTVDAGTSSITISGQTGSGSQKYVIVINGLINWEEWVDFV